MQALKVFSRIKLFSNFVSERMKNRKRLIRLEKHVSMFILQYRLYMYIA